MPHRTMPVLRRRRCDGSAALDDHGVSLLHGPQLPATHLEIARHRVFGEALQGPRGYSGRRGHQRGDDQTSLEGTRFVATVPLVCCIAAAAGDLSRRLLLQRVADLPEIVDFLTPPRLLQGPRRSWPGRDARRGGGVVGVLRRRRVSDVVATAGAGVRR